jgi:hypothetical protein
VVFEIVAGILIGPSVRMKMIADNVGRGSSRA